MLATQIQVFYDHMNTDEAEQKEIQKKLQLKLKYLLIYFVHYSFL